MAFVTAVVVATLGWLVFATVRSIRNEKVPGRGVWKDFGLGLVLMLLFFVTWIAHGVTEWQVYTDEQKEHGQPVEAGDFFAQFGQGTLENWQSEFLQLFSFVTLAALYVHKGSAESKDGDEEIKESLQRIEERLGILEKVPEKAR